jgi:hypothetical protein
MPGLPAGADDDSVILRFQFDLFGKVTALQQQFRDADALRITDFTIRVLS